MPARQIVHITLRNHNDHPLTGTSQKDTIRIFKVNLALIFPNMIPLVANK